MNKIIIGIIFFGVLIIAWYLISPVFIVKEMHEAAPVQLEQSAESEKKNTLTTDFKPSAHDVQGQAMLIQNQEGSILRFEDFNTINGPDLRIYLSTGLDVNDAIDLGPIKATKGSVNYNIPQGVDTSKYNKVLVWCRAFGVLFSYAEFP